MNTLSAASRNSAATRITDAHWIDSDPNYATEFIKKFTAGDKHVSGFSYKSYVYLESRTNPNWWNTFRAVAIGACLKFTIT